MKMHTDAQECTKMRMGKNNTTFGKKQHSIRENVNRIENFIHVNSRPGEELPKSEKIRCDSRSCMCTWRERFTNVASRVFDGQRKGKVLFLNTTRRSPYCAH